MSDLVKNPEDRFSHNEAHFSVCKYLAIELRDRLEETGKSKEVLETGHGIDPRKKKKIKYNTS